jgi:hypothetical protein
MTPADAIRAYGRAEAYHEAGARAYRQPTGIAREAFYRAAHHLHMRFHRAIREALLPEWPDYAEPAEVRRRAEALARQMELGALLAAESRVRAWDELPERRAA